MKNVKRDENSPVEKIEGRLKRFRTNELDGRKRIKLREEKGWEGGKNKGNLEGRTDEYLEDTTPVERKQRLHTSRMDTRLQTLVPRKKKGRVGGKRKQLRIELGKDEEARVNLTRNAPDEKS